uniref:Intradiol RING-cleavage dioxygenase n=1 Tax=Mycena chlorophos TaxID=658473 RepID=A0ABQ0L737_MYCCL|nr:intradiol RING-cleavage dioxygenase [Mycena chlorophos]
MSTGAETDQIMAHAAKLAAEAGVDLSKLPKNLDMTSETITENVHVMNSGCTDERLKFIMKNLINHLHDFVKETSITSEEWMSALMFLTRTGQTCTPLRQEFILLSDILGVSSLVDDLNHPTSGGATEATVLGPFFTEDALHFENGESIASEGKGDYMWVEGRVLDLKGNPIRGAIIDTWETDGHGKYDNQYENRAASGPECRGRITTTENGDYFFRAIVPVSYPIPGDATVGEALKALGRHVFRPAHLHMMLTAPGFEKLTTALYFKGDPYLYSDAVFGVKSSLVVVRKTASYSRLALPADFDVDYFRK